MDYDTRNGSNGSVIGIPFRGNNHGKMSTPLTSHSPMHWIGPRVHFIILNLNVGPSN